MPFQIRAAPPTIVAAGREISWPLEPTVRTGQTSAYVRAPTKKMRKRNRAIVDRSGDAVLSTDALDDEVAGDWLVHVAAGWRCSAVA